MAKGRSRDTELKAWATLAEWRAEALAARERQAGLEARASRFEEVQTELAVWKKQSAAQVALAEDDVERAEADLERARRALKEVRVLVLSYPNVLRRLDEALAEARERGEDGWAAEG